MFVFLLATTLLPYLFASAAGCGGILYLQSGHRCACDPGYELRPDGKTCASACGSTITNSSGVITSPNYPDSYANNLHCNWKIQADDNKLVRITFTDFNLESSPGCSKDQIQIADSSSIKTYCGSTLPNSILSHGNVSIIFTTDDSDSSTGFSLDYETFYDACDSFEGNCQHGCTPIAEGSKRCTCQPGYTLQPNGLDCKMDPCHFEIAATSGTIQSPNYPDNYLNNQNCTWSIKTTPGNIIKINFTDIELENNSGCAYDAIEIYDGLSMALPLIDTLCGTPNKTVIETSSQNEMFISFRSDNSNTYRGFQAEYGAVCGAKLHASTTENYIYSHADYGLSNYSFGMECLWTIAPTPGFDTIVTVEELDVEPTAQCGYDHIDIWQDYLWLKRFCGTEPPEPFVASDAWNFTIEFATDYSINRKGFKIRKFAIY